MREFLDEDFPGGFISEKDVIGTRQRNKSCAGNFSRQYSALFAGTTSIVITLNTWLGAKRRGEGRAR